MNEIGENSGEPTPSRRQELLRNLVNIRQQIEEAAQGRQVRLVAVSKLKPASDIAALYDDGGQRHFGENYVAELAEKAKLLPQDINWHFIGALQTNKCKTLASIPNLFAVETVDSIKKADALNKARTYLVQNSSSPIRPLQIYLQINTSDEPTKAGLRVDETSLVHPDLLALAKFIKHECSELELTGLMTIGSIEQSIGSEEQNKDFEKLVKIRDALTAQLDTPLGLSMGMSSDFSLAIRLGSDNVRVGSKIFGQRPPFKSSS
ncbi:hypothetical protein CROQUDRAFT_77866 [Cronartium quercuum f. sp. fusiforme G11]|uniref:Pyridoxal phosphate homeostasis protein n=1 Tax=Cronartium quercuum f. sp. fusiforme G11 TaxID=708437 RepID=A0A9P6NLL0_9BASI|nr:hypothetical protein CROQUDRAFT_77866 [Cronartium quercuum f. sp. fusiforme G11]